MRSDPQTELGISEEANRVISHLSSAPTTSLASANSAVVRKIMLDTDGQLILQGRIFDIKAKSLGAGVYRLTLKEIVSI